MLEKILIILGAGALCGGWILLRAWIKKVDPDTREIEVTCCGARAQKKECCGKHH